MTAHEPDCPLHPQQWLRHAAAAAGALAQVPPDDLADRDAAMLLADALAYLVEVGGPARVTLQDVAGHALMMDRETEAGLCECGAANA